MVFFKSTLHEDFKTTTFSPFGWNHNSNCHLNIGEIVQIKIGTFFSNLTNIERPFQPNIQYMTDIGWSWPRCTRGPHRGNGRAGEHTGMRKDTNLTQKDYGCPQITTKSTTKFIKMAKKYTTNYHKWQHYKKLVQNIQNWQTTTTIYENTNCSTSFKIYCGVLMPGNTW